MICIDLRPLSLVENQGFSSLVEVLEPRYKMPSRKYFSDKIIPELFESVKKNIILDLKFAEFICFSTDMWSSQFTTQSYMSLTAHWISKNFEQKTALLSCESFDKAHTGDNISEAFNVMISKADINPNKIFAIVHDNAANVKKAFKFHPSKQILYIINSIKLVIKDGLDKKYEIANTLCAVRKIVGHFKSSTTARAKLMSIQERYNFPILQTIQDVTTRWNSTSYMLRRFLQIRESITLFLVRT
jgi:hypothetical protein